LQKYYDALPDKDRPSRPQIIIQNAEDIRPEYIVKPSSKATPVEGGNDDTILTAEDVNSNLLTIRTEMMTEMESNEIFCFINSIIMIRIV